LASCAFLRPLPALAVDGNTLPSGGAVVGGAAVLDYGAANELHVRQSSQRAAIDWDSFNIGKDALTEFHQPGRSSVTVNRVTGGNADPTQILGHLKANGTVLVLDRNGVIFGQDSHVDVGGIVAAAGDIDIDKFMGGGHVQITDINPDGFVINAGMITVADAGLAAFVAPNILNSGIIEARLGRIDIAGGTQATLDLYGDGLVELAVSEDSLSQTLINSGILHAESGSIRLTAAAAKDIVDNLILNTGVIIADSLGTDNQGRITLYAEKGTTVQAGLLDATGLSGGERGGSIEVLGDNVILARDSIIDASGLNGGGDIKIGGDYLGQGGTPTSVYTYVDQGALIFNDAILNGDGGKTIVWADETTAFYGAIYGRGGALSGDGGFVETSGKINLLAQGFVDLTAVNGNKGTYLLDPADISVYGNFDPTNIPNGVMWLDASQLTGYNNNDTVATWTDQFGLNDMIAFSTGPTYQENSLNGLPTLLFNGNGMQTANNLSFGDWSIFMAFQDSSVVNYERLMDHDYVNGFWFGRNGSTASSFGGGVKETGGSYGRFTTVTDGQWNLIGNQRSGTTHTIWANGDFYSGASGMVDGMATGSNRVAIGAWHNNSTPGQNASGISISEIIVYSDDLSDANRHLVEQYQSAKWNIALTPPGTGATEADKAMAADGYGAFTTRYLEHLSDSADIVLQATNSITLDLRGDTLNLANDRSISLVTTAGDISTASAGTIATTRTGTGGNITLTSGNDINIDHALVLNAAGGGLVTLDAAGDINGSASFDSSSAVTLSAGDDIAFTAAVGGNTRLGVVTVTAADAFTAGSFRAASFTHNNGTGATTFNGAGLNTTGNISIASVGIGGTFTGLGGSLNSGAGTIGATTTLNTLNIAGAGATLLGGSIGAPGVVTQAMANLITIGGLAGSGNPLYTFGGFNIGYVAPPVKSAPVIPVSVSAIMANPVVTGGSNLSPGSGSSSSSGTGSPESEELLQSAAPEQSASTPGGAQNSLLGLVEFTEEALEYFNL
jgi:filamentous hemagglutinin family protein